MIPWVYMVGTGHVFDPTHRECSLAAVDIQPWLVNVDSVPVGWSEVVDCRVRNSFCASENI